MLDFGGYCKSPIIDLLKKNPEIPCYIYYGEYDYLDY